MVLFLLCHPSPSVDENVWNKKTTASKLEGRTPLHWAAVSGQDETAVSKTAKYIIDHAAKKMPQDAQGWNPLHIAAAFRRVTMVKTILNAIGSDSSAINQHAFKVCERMSFDQSKKF